MMRALLCLLVVITLPVDAAAQEPTPAAPPLPATPIPPVTDADRQAAFPDVHGHAVHDSGFQFKVLFDQLEWQRLHGAHGLRWDTKGWFGGDINRLWIKSEGEAVDGELDETEIKAFYGRSLTPWWDLLVGVRHELRPSPTHTWLAVGIHGLAPQWFEVEATAYVGPGGHVAARLEAEYDLLLTNRLVLQPLVELSLSGKDDPDRRIGRGLSTGEVGFRLRYEIRRELAPYLGLVWHRKLFGTADAARAGNHDIGGWHVVAGVRTWF
jgi:copper resistance protein B